ncbi:Interactor of constitutive active ROPs 2 [Olea europaea subsp. europaea]|uniref:Interactor of constitutive active ROPs 2 n=1 Tax=Olea europaea subsp. europaea TaxID=158383 RepID=A0A8S0S5G8_OLEEU|nr:Interactor of constitutive active ROPs 2 [Olea europaea subsp. europaea]
MSQSSEDSSRVGPEFDLPYEILSVIPKDPYDQLDLARKITSMAIASRVTMLESETGRLRQKLHEKDRVIVELQDKVSQVEQAYEEAELRLKSTREDNMKLLKERDSLALTTKKLSRDLAKLETFKRQLMQSLNDENSPQTETVDIGTYDHTVSKAYTKNDEDTNGYVRCHSYSGSTDTASITDNASKQAGRIYSITPYITSGLTPIGTPKVISNSATPGRYSAAGSPKKTSGTTSPRIQYGSGSLSSWYPSSQQSSATNSPPRGLPVPARPPRIDGKEFFRQARSRLSLEQFSAFLANIKELNAQKKSREETLRKAEEIFGMENKDLYLSFQGLLNRNKH